MKRWLVVLMVLGWLWPVPVQAQGELPQDTWLHVIVLYDGNHDGEEEGVGPGVGITVTDLHRGDVRVGVTRELSSQAFLVQPGEYHVQAYVEPTRWFFEWVCVDDSVAVPPTAILILHCREAFALHLPWASAGTVVE